MLLALALGHTGLGKLVELLFDKGRAQAISSRGANQSTSTTHPSRRIFLALFTMIYVLALHGSNSIKLILILALNYTLAKVCAGQRVYAPLIIWTFGIGTLFLVHWNEGLPWSVWLPAFSFLDNYTGLLPRWQINFNISMLRLVSFAMDLHWARLAPARLYEPAPSAEKRGRTPLKEAEYNWTDYLFYVLYPPLFVAGPIMTFNDFSRQLKDVRCKALLSIRGRLTYAIRLATSMLTMEAILHFVYVNAIKDSKAWTGNTPMQLSMIGFWNLIIVWLKVSGRPDGAGPLAHSLCSVVSNTRI